MANSVPGISVPGTSVPGTSVPGTAANESSIHRQVPNPSLEQGLFSDNMAFTSVPFALPQGLQTKTGQVYRQGQMRLATGADELMAHRAAHMLENAAYGVLVRLARVVTLADWQGLDPLSPDDLGHAFMPDLRYLLELYNTLNPPDYGLSLLGEMQAIP